MAVLMRVMFERILPLLSLRSVLGFYSVTGKGNPTIHCDVSLICFISNETRLHPCLMDNSKGHYAPAIVIFGGPCASVDSFTSFNVV